MGDRLRLCFRQRVARMSCSGRHELASNRTRRPNGCVRRQGGRAHLLTACDTRHRADVRVRRAHHRRLRREACAARRARHCARRSAPDDRDA